MQQKYRTPYYAVIFTSKLANDTPKYAKLAARMEELAQQQDGFLGMDHARSEMGITVSYWDSEEAIHNWKNHHAHQVAQELGKSEFYDHYSVRICKVERHYDFTRQKD